MRRDEYIENDSGGFSVLAVVAVDAIIEDQRSDDFQFVAGHNAMLLELYGDDSLPVRIVVDEPLTPLVSSRCGGCEPQHCQWRPRGRRGRCRSDWLRRARHAEMVRLAEPDERSLLMLATNVFRVRFADQWPADAVENDEDDEDGD